MSASVGVHSAVVEDCGQANANARPFASATLRCGSISSYRTSNPQSGLYRLGPSRLSSHDQRRGRSPSTRSTPAPITCSATSYPSTRIDCWMLRTSRSRPPFAFRSRSRPCSSLSFVVVVTLVVLGFTGMLAISPIRVTSPLRHRKPRLGTAFPGAARDYRSDLGCLHRRIGTSRAAPRFPLRSQANCARRTEPSSLAHSAVEDLKRMMGTGDANAAFPAQPHPKSIRSTTAILESGEH